MSIIVSHHCSVSQLSIPKRNAFSLLEMVIAVTLVSVVGLALIQSAANNHKLIGNAIEQSDGYRAYTYGLLFSDQEIYFTQTNLYDLIKERFLIRSDEMTTIMKDKRIGNYQQNIVSSVPITSYRNYSSDSSSLNERADLKSMRYTMGKKSYTIYTLQMNP